MLYDKVIEGLEPFDPIELNVNVRSDKPQGLRFFEKRGFSEHMREGESHLDVMAFDPAPYDGLEDKLRREGIEIKTLRELEGRCGARSQGLRSGMGAHSGRTRFRGVDPGALRQMARGRHRVASAPARTPSLWR